MTTFHASWNEQTTPHHTNSVYQAYGFTPESARCAQAEDEAINRYLAELMGESLVPPTPSVTKTGRFRDWARSHDALCILALLPIVAWTIIYACIEFI